MRGYECYHNGCMRACWSSVMGYNPVIIGRFRHLSTKKYRKLLVSLINKITPCKIKGAKIYYTPIEGYDNNLILLSFIRNLWHEPKAGYTKKFFEALKKSDLKDPLERLTFANKEACEEDNYPAGHCNCHKKSKLKIKSTKDLIGKKLVSTQHFLTGTQRYDYSG